ncbi:MAG: GNAT family N-acetyltransferase [Christensenellales bacterium]
MNMKFKGVMLRPVESTDLHILQRLFNDPEVNQDTMGWEFPVSMDQQNAWFSTLKNNKSVFRAMIENEAGETVGEISLANIDYKNRTASIGGAKILNEYQSIGYGVKAFIAMLDLVFDQMNFYCIEIQHLESQLVTKHVMEKMGFVLEGTLRQRIHKNGQRHDIMVWSVTADEYKIIRARYKG